VIKYFAYGANIDPGRMTARLPGSTVVGPAVLDDYVLEFTIRDREWGGGVANIRPEAGRRVYGLLWGVPEEEFATLDTYRGDESHHRRDEVSVRTADSTVAAVTFRVEQIANHVAPSFEYLKHLRGAMAAQGLPPEAVEAVDEADRFGAGRTGPSIVS
jgi:AIG2-like family